MYRVGTELSMMVLTKFIPSHSNEKEYGVEESDFSKTKCCLTRSTNRPNQHWNTKEKNIHVDISRSL